jgi:predicted XRE-type DNA-binding protein
MTTKLEDLDPDQQLGVAVANVLLYLSDRNLKQKSDLGVVQISRARIQALHKAFEQVWPGVLDGLRKDHEETKA